MFDSKYLNMLKNKLSIKEQIRETINKVKIDYKELDKDKTCILYSHYIYSLLREKHIDCTLVSLKEFGIDYDHRFVLVKENDYYYLIDLTYEQFFKEIPKDFDDLYEFGYTIVDQERINDYIISISGVYTENKINDIYNRSR